MTVTDKTYVVLPGMKDRVGRTYSREQLEPFLGNDFYGYVGHSFGSTIELRHVSHKAKNLRIEDGNVVADVEILETPSGKILSEMVAADAKLELSMAALGIANADSTVTELQIISINMVAAI